MRREPLDISLIAPFALQAGVMMADEFGYHRRRGLPRWERLGHPVDTFSTMACYAWLLAARPSPRHRAVYGALAAASSLLVTKDEPTHARVCSRGEHWLHAALFLLHPFVLIRAGRLWWASRLRPLIAAELALTAAFGAYQLTYWSRRGPR